MIIRYSEKMIVRTATTATTMIMNQFRLPPSDTGASVSDTNSFVFTMTFDAEGATAATTGASLRTHPRNGVSETSEGGRDERGRARRARALGTKQRLLARKHQSTTYASATIANGLGGTAAT